MQILEEQEHSVEMMFTASEAEHIARNVLDNAQIAGPAAVALAELLQKEGFTADKLPHVALRHEWKTPDDMGQNT